VLGTIMRANPRWARLRVPPPFDVRQTLQRLPHGWSALSFFWQGTRLHVFAGDGIAASVEWRPDEIDALKKSFAHVRTAAASELLHVDHVIPPGLARKIFPGEIDRWLVTQERVLISPHGPLKSAPLHAVKLGTGKRLIEIAAVQYIPTLALLGLERRQPAHDRVLLLGCERDSFGNVPLDDVPFEIESLRRVWGFQAVDRSLAPTARFGADLPEPSHWRNFRVLHFACHGKFEPDRPLDARFFLGGEAVRATELFAVRLDADIACFSACDLGAHGEAEDAFDTAGDEWLGLSLPLFYAGARTVMVSVGKAISSEAVRVMEAFHTELAAGKSPADACQSALRRVQKRPEGFWANWYLAGLPS
jgi:CHAT domain-containing protein